MSASELAELEALLVKALPDPMAFVERIMGELASRLANATPSGEAPRVVPGFESAAHDAVIDQNLLLAGALGACDCWGRDDDCPICSGEGRSGWVEPHTALYDEYVAPAVGRVQTAHRSAGSTRPPHTDPRPTTTEPIAEPTAEPTDEAAADQSTEGGRP